MGAGGSGWMCWQAETLRGQLRCLESTLIGSIKMKRKWSNFALWCHLELQTESAEVKLVEKLNNPLIYYRLSTGIIRPKT